MRLVLAAVLLMAAVSAYAQPTQPTVKATKADAEKVVKAISADKGKTQTYCQITKLGERIVEAEQKNNEAEVEDLSKQMQELVEKLGPEYANLINAIQDVDPNSQEGQDIDASLLGLEKLCRK